MIINKKISKVHRNTIQRIKILEYLRSVRTHPNAETIFKEVKKEIPTITLATVYRNLNQMVEEGRILRLDVNGEFHFDEEIKPHEHYICEKCGKITDSYRSEAFNIAMKETENGFKTREVLIFHRGICKECQNKGGN